MKTNLFKLFALMVALLIGGGTKMYASAISSSFIQAPMKIGSYVNLNDANANGFTFTNATIEKNDAYAVGSTSKNTELTFRFYNSKAGDCLFSFRSGTKAMTVDVNVKVTDNSSYAQEQDFNVPNTGSWNRTTQHNMVLKNLPKGNITVTLTVKKIDVIDATVANSYAGNYGNFSLTSLDDYDKMSSITLANGIYSNSRMYETKNENVGYCSDGATAEYTAYNAIDGFATLKMGLQYIGDGTLKLTVTDMETGKTEMSKDLKITKDICHGYDTPTSFEIGNISQGLKNIKLEVSTEASFLCNYKNLGFTVAPQATVGETGFATIGFPCAVTLPEGVKAYAITSVNNNTVTLTQVNSTAVAANTGLIICAKPGTYTFAQATEGDEIADNKLVANTDAEKVAEAEKEFYVLGVTDATKKTVGMMPIAAKGTVGQYKAYLPATEVTSLAKGLKIVFGGDQATAISEVEANGAEATNNAAYNVLGQRVNGNAKGIVIINGKKYIK